MRTSHRTAVATAKATAMVPTVVPLLVMVPRELEHWAVVLATSEAVGACVVDWLVLALMVAALEGTVEGHSTHCSHCKKRRCTCPPSAWYALRTSHRTEAATAEQTGRAVPVELAVAKVVLESWEGVQGVAEERVMVVTMAVATEKAVMVEVAMAADKVVEMVEAMVEETASGMQEGTEACSTQRSRRKH